MKELIEALTILAKYGGEIAFPTQCEHDVLYVAIDPAEVTAEDISKLEEKGFHADTNEQHFYSFRYGSC